MSMLPLRGGKSLINKGGQNSVEATSLRVFDGFEGMRGKIVNKIEQFVGMRFVAMFQRFVLRKMDGTEIFPIHHLCFVLFN